MRLPTLISMAISATSLLVGCDGSSPAAPTPPRPSATGIWNGWIRLERIDVSPSICAGGSFDAFQGRAATFDLHDDAGIVSGALTITIEQATRRVPVSGTFDGSRMELSAEPDDTDCLLLPCPDASVHQLCRSGAVFSGDIHNVDSWRGEWSLSFEDRSGSVTLSGPFRTDR